MSSPACARATNASAMVRAKASAVRLAAANGRGPRRAETKFIELPWIVDRAKAGLTRVSLTPAWTKTGGPRPSRHCLEVPEQLADDLDRRLDGFALGALDLKRDL